MELNFKGTAIYRAIKMEKFPVFGLAKILSGVFSVVLLVSALMLALSFAGMFSGNTALFVFALSFSFYLFFYEADLFFRLKIKNPPAPASSSNIAEFLDFESAKVVFDALKFSKKKKIRASSACLLYSLCRMSREAEVILFRLGIGNRRLQESIKNYLEKNPKEPGQEGIFSADFEPALAGALEFSKKMNRQKIEPASLLAGIAQADEFFKKLLVDFDLKMEDVENLISWLGSAQDAFKNNSRFWTKENLARAGSYGKDLAAGYTITLDNFSIDWRKIVSKWTFKEIVGHENEIKEAELALAKSEYSNALLVGEDGTGRKSIIQALAQKCHLGTSLPELNGKRVVELDMVRLISAVDDPEKMERVLEQIFAEVLYASNVILVIDNFENYVGLKEHKPGQADVSAILSKYLAMPRFQFVGICSYAGFHKNVEQGAFSGFFRKIEVKESTEQETIKILQNSALYLESQKKIIILYPAIREIVNLTARYIPSLPFPKKALDVLSEVVVYAESLKEKVVMPHHVAEVMSRKTEVPVGKMEVKEKEVLLNLENLIHKRIVNQEEAVKEISIAMRRARAGIASKTRPMGTFLFLGPTGVGKTETAKALAQIYFGNENKMIRLDMSEFQAIADIPRLIGSTTPVEVQGLLTTPVRETPFSLILLDEIEKAHKDILNLFLQVLDEGHITDGQGRKVVFTNTIIICTSNAAAEMIFKEVETGKEVKRDELLNSLFAKKIFRPEFVNRFDATVVFHPLSKENLLKIAQLSLQGLQKNLKEKEIDFVITEDLKEKIVELSYKPAFGAREMRRVIQDKVENIVAEALIADKIKKGDKIEIKPENFGLAVNGIDTAAESDKVKI